MAAKASRNNRVRLYIPSRDRHGKHVANEKLTAAAEELFARLFGGCTCFDARGIYVVETGRFIKERIKIVESICTQQELAKHLPAVRTFAVRVKSELKQEALALEINSVLEFI